MEMKTEERVVSTKPAESGRERRTSERFPCGGAVELLRLPPAPRQTIRGKIHNLSQGGCYVQTESPLEVGWRLAVVMNLKELELRLIAEVRSAKSDPKCWAGLEFVGITAEGFAKLKALIEKFAGEKQAGG
jgi:PilZ domain